MPLVPKPLSLWIPGCERVCAWALEEDAWESGHLPSYLNGILTDFHSQTLWGLLLPAPEPWAVEPGVVLGPLAPPGGTTASEASLPLLHTWLRVGVGPACSASPPLLPVSTRLLYVLSYRASVQLDLRWFCRLIGL